MQKYVHKIEDLEKLFDKLKFETEKYDSVFSAILFRLDDSSRISEFQEFLLKYIRISDSVFMVSDNKVLLILEDTTIRWAINFGEDLAKKIKQKGFSYKYYCSAIQWDYIESEKKLLKSLKKRLKKAKEEKRRECVIEL